MPSNGLPTLHKEVIMAGVSRLESSKRKPMLRVDSHGNRVEECAICAELALLYKLGLARSTLPRNRVIVHLKKPVDFMPYCERCLIVNI